MRLPVATHTLAVKIRLMRKVALSFLCVSTAVMLPPQMTAQHQSSTSTARERMHQSDQWMEIQRHLPDPATASPQILEQQGDILRARRFPEDALDFYKYALARGGNVPALLNKLGLTELEMRNIELARSYFQRAVKMDKKNGEAWNNLGAVEFIDGQAGSAVSDYKKAIKLKKHEPVFHANLATAYFETKNYGAARREIAVAMKLDPQIFDRQAGLGGVAAHVLSSEDRSRFSFEMAKLYAQNGLEEQMIHSLSVASEAGMDVQREMRRDSVLAKYEMDPRVIVLVHNAQALRTGSGAALGRSSNADTGSGSTATKPL
jgi:tetratricopeptide (TPR) repeat protein